MARRISGTTGKDSNGNVPIAARVVDVVREFGLSTAVVLGAGLEVPRLLPLPPPFAAPAAPPEALLPWLPPSLALFFLLFRRRFFRFFAPLPSPLLAPFLRLSLPPLPPPRPLFWLPANDDMLFFLKKGAEVGN